MKTVELDRPGGRLALAVEYVLECVLHPTWTSELFYDEEAKHIWIRRTK